ncbi:MAG: helix-turn-helix transcriptional regulator [Clostridia bacterium]|nr:helix-turn-helix transcriptional regulator [Clostridia bacterium]
MSISENIAKYRKAKGYTQEKLGELLGVTNQAVSKWELGVSMPDVMLLPKITEALGITFNDLYGIESNEQQYVKADDFPKAANDMLVDFFGYHSKEKFHTVGLEEPWSLVCLSDTKGGTYISSKHSFVDCTFKESGGEEIFNNREIASALMKLADGKLRSVLSYMYKKSFGDNTSCNRSFLLSEIADACEMTENEALDVMEKLTVLRMIEKADDGNVTEYVLLKFRAFLALEVFAMCELLIRESFCYEVLRDTSQINDYAFEKLW